MPVVLVLAAFVPLGAPAAAVRIAGGAPATTLSSCLHPLGGSDVKGSLTFTGGPLAPSAVDDAGLVYTYYALYRIVNLTSGTVESSGCRALNGSASTSASGGFSFVLALPVSHCSISANGTICTSYAEVPFGPLTVLPSAGIPAAYDLLAQGSDAALSLDLVYQWASASLDPSGPIVTTSVGLPTTVGAQVWSADGKPTDLVPTWHWELNGSGWKFDGATSEASVEVVAFPGAGVANLTVRVDAAVDGVVLAPMTVSVQLVAVPTEIESGELNRTAIDVGQSVRVELTASGAADLSYAATVDPGLGLPTVPAPCLVTPAGAGSVDLACNATLSYPVTGTAQPTANVSNGASSASWKLAEVVVSASPSLQVAATEIGGYVGRSIPLTVSAVGGAGARPFRSACLQVGGDAPICESTGGPSWSFAPIVDAVGNYTAEAWAHDATGANTSIAFPVEVVAPLSVGAIDLPAGNATADAPLEVAAAIDGGLLPLHYWWNVSGVAEPVASGTIRADGEVNATLAPAVAGPLELSLSVLDRLGSVIDRSLLVNVAPADAQSIAPVVLPPAGPVPAGAPVTLAWEAFLAGGSIDRSFSAPAELSLDSPAGAPRAWVNASGVGPLVHLGAGAYSVPAAAWVGGRLNVSVVVANATTVSVALAGEALPGSLGALTLNVEPDRTEVRLFGPVVRESGARSNSTFWYVTDRYGNPAPGALLSENLAFGSLRSSSIVAAIAVGDGESGVWVNYSALDAGAGTLTVLDAAGVVVLGPVAIPAVAPTPGLKPSVAVAATALPIGGAGATALAVVRRRRRSQGAAAADLELRDLAEGRSRALDLVRGAGAIDLAGLEAAWEPPPAPPALADWLASLVADGTLTATLGADGSARFCVSDRNAPPPRVTLDAEALERSLRRRDDALAGGPPKDGPD